MILKEKTIVIFGNTRYDSPIQATSFFIARNLAKDNKVFFIDYPFTVKDYLKNHNSQAIKERKNKFSFFSNGVVETDIPNFKLIITPLLLPLNFLPEGTVFRFLLKINEALIKSRLKKLFKKNNSNDFIYINAFNFHYPSVAKDLKPALTIYHCVDPMIIPYDRKHGIISEEKLVKESDIVICTSNALYQEKKLINKNTYFVANGSETFIDEQTAEIIEHSKITKIKRPIIGYIGTIERRINYPLLEEVIKLNPDKSFVFAGPVNHDYVPEQFHHFTNLHFVGPIPYKEVPQMINSFDVAIIPFKKDEVSDTIFPIKLFEYMSKGKPIVITDFNNDLKDFTGSCVEYCNDALSFSKAITESLESDCASKIMERKLLATENTWEHRSNQISKIINSHLQLLN